MSWLKQSFLIVIVACLAVFALEDNTSEQVQNILNYQGKKPFFKPIFLVQESTNRPPSHHNPRPTHRPTKRPHQNRPPIWGYPPQLLFPRPPQPQFPPHPQFPPQPQFPLYPPQPLFIVLPPGSQIIGNGGINRTTIRDSADLINNRKTTSISSDIIGNIYNAESDYNTEINANKYHVKLDDNRVPYPYFSNAEVTEPFEGTEPQEGIIVNGATDDLSDYIKDISTTHNTGEGSNTLTIDTGDIKLPFGIQLLSQQTAATDYSDKKEKSHEALIYIRNLKKGRKLEAV